MLGDCYAAAIVEHLSKEQLVAADAAVHQVRKKLNLYTVTSLLSPHTLFVYFFLQYQNLLQTNTEAKWIVLLLHTWEVLRKLFYGVLLLTYIL
jgi:hypothetical protein